MQMGVRNILRKCWKCRSVFRKTGNLGKKGNVWKIEKEREMDVNVGVRENLAYQRFAKLGPSVQCKNKIASEARSRSLCSNCECGRRLCTQ